MPNCGSRFEPRDELAMPRHHRRDEHTDLAVLGSSPRREARVPPPRRRPSLRESEPYEPTLGLVRDRTRHRASRPPGSRSHRPRGPHRSAVATTRSSGTGTPKRATSALDSASERVVKAPATGAYPTDRVHHDRGRGGLLRHAVVVDRPRRGVAVVRGARPHRLHVRAEGRPQAPRAMARALRRRRARRASVRSSIAPACASASRSRPGSRSTRDRRPIALRSRRSSRRCSASASRTSACSSTTSRLTLPDPRESAARPTPTSPPGSTTVSVRSVLLSLVPTEYIGTLSSPYLDALARLLPPRHPDRLDRGLGRERRDHRGRRSGAAWPRSAGGRPCCGTTCP